MNYLVIIVITLIFSAFFSGMEIAFLASNKLRLELNRKQGLFSSRIISIFLANPSQFIATILVGNNIALVIYGLSMARLLEPGIRHITSNESAILITQTLISTIIILFTAEFLPKTLVRINPNAVLTFMSVPLIIIFLLMYPVTYLITSFSDLIIKKISKSDMIEIKKRCP